MRILSGTMASPTKIKFFIFCISFHRFSVQAGRYSRGLTPKQYENCKRDTFVFDEQNCVTERLDFFIFKRGRRDSWVIRL